MLNDSSFVSLWCVLFDFGGVHWLLEEFNGYVRAVRCQGRVLPASAWRYHMKIWFEVIEYNCNLFGGGEEVAIGTFDTVHDAIRFERQQRLEYGSSTYKTFQTIVQHEDDEEENANA